MAGTYITTEVVDWLKIQLVKRKQLRLIMTARAAAELYDIDIFQCANQMTLFYSINNRVEDVDNNRLL
jgi:hypothetical protein